MKTTLFFLKKNWREEMKAEKIANLIQISLM